MVVAMSSSEPTLKNSISSPYARGDKGWPVLSVGEMECMVLNLASNKSDIERRVHASIDKFGCTHCIN
ncbi:hypothetical protein Syun_021364 [Stephania yunnanensis]|uniref:Uncharacterized protein n=1 Tax=Stephania yunnanensis TaxID=152371 RepID=A0AAP0IFV6_9MAGN